MVPNSPLGLGLYLYIIAGLSFIIELLIFETSRNVKSMRRKAKEKDRLDEEAIKWLRRIEHPDYDPMRYKDEF